MNKDNRKTVAVVGCGNAKRSSRSAIRDLYTSNYFQLKREYAEEFADHWFVLSAEHDLIAPWETVSPYDTTIADIDDETFVVAIAETLRSSHNLFQEASELLVLAGSEYADRFQRALERERELTGELTESVVETTDVTYLFEEIDAGGIGEQMGFLREAADAGLRRPDRDSQRPQTAIDQFESSAIE